MEIPEFPGGSAHGLVTFADLTNTGLDLGAIQRRVRDGALHRLRRGVYVDRDYWESLDELVGRPLLRIHAARLTIKTPHAVSHDSASLLLGIGIPDARTSLVHVTRPHVTGTRIQAGIKHHGATIFDGHLTQIDGIPTLSLDRTACDIAREHGSAHGTAACSLALRMGASRAGLRRVREQMWCWPRVRSAQRAIDQADPMIESYLEGLALDLLADLRLGRPECQFGLTDGQRQVFADMRIGRQIYEVDGREKYDLPGMDPRDRLWNEKKRQDFLGSFKLGVSRITAFDCLAGRPAALRRLAREYADTTARFGTDISDLAPYRITRQRAG